MVKITEITPPVEKRYNIEVSEVEKELISNALLHYRNIDYYCGIASSKLVREAFRGQTSKTKADLALSIIQDIRSE
jgi:hypothetical protein